MLSRKSTIALLLAGIGMQVCVNAQTQIGAKGTAQMEGAAGVFGRPYSLGSKGSQANFTLKSAQYTINPVAIGTYSCTPKAGEKLLVIRYTIHNPEKSQLLANATTFGFTAVDADDVNYNPVPTVGQETSKARLSMPLKPAQKVEAFAIIPVTAKGEIPKLIVMRHQPPVLRYDLRGKVAPLEPAYADPSDPTGATVLSEVSAQQGVWYRAGEFDFRVIAMQPDTSSTRPGMAVQVEIRNQSVRELPVLPTLVKTEMDTDAGAAKAKQGLYDGRSSTRIPTPKLAPGKQLSGFWLFETSPNAQPLTMTVTTSNNIRHMYTFNAPVEP